MTLRPTNRVLAVLAVVIAVVLPGCAKHRSNVDLGLRRVTLDLAFKDESKAPPKSALTAILGLQEPVGGAQQLLSQLGSGQITIKTPTNPFAAFACPSAPASAVPDEPVTGVVGKPPAIGTYNVRNQGTFALDGPLKLAGPYPPISSMKIVDISDDTANDETGSAVRTITFDVVETSALATTTTRYQSVTREIARALPTAPSALASELDLVSAETTSAGQTTTFHPTPPVTLMQYNGEGSSWTSAGMDQSTGTLMTVRGSIIRREPIDVCGKLIDTFRVESNEQVTNPLTQYSSQTATNDPTVYNIATQFGGLVVRKYVNAQTTVVAYGGVETLTIKNIATMMSVTPR